MNCRKCGTELPAGAMFCAECGATVTAPRLVEPQTRTRPGDTAIIPPLDLNVSAPAFLEPDFERVPAPPEPVRPVVAAPVVPATPVTRVSPAVPAVPPTPPSSVEPAAARVETTPARPVVHPAVVPVVVTADSAVADSAAAQPAAAQPDAAQPDAAQPVEVAPAPVTPAPVTPAPVTPAQPAPALVVPASVAPAPATRAPATPASATPAPATRAPATPASATPASAAPAPTVRLTPPAPQAQPPVSRPPVAQAPTAPVATPAASSFESQHDDLEATRIVRNRQGDRFVLQFSTGENSTVFGSGLIGRNPVMQPGEYVDQLVTIVDSGKSVSKTHLEFGQTAGVFWIIDRFSANGTVVRQPDVRPQRVDPGKRQIIARGTRVDIGEQFFVVS